MATLTRPAEVIDMNSMVVYGSRYGNTQKVAEAIAGALRSRGPAQVVAVDEAPGALPEEVDLLVVGGPTEGHRMTEPVVRFFERSEPYGLRGTAAAAFDTRLRLARWLSGSAGAGIERRLRKAGARVISPAASFFVKGRANAPDAGGPVLDPGELERAAAWADSLADRAAEARQMAGRAG